MTHTQVESGERVVIDVRTLYAERALLDHLPLYKQAVLALAGAGKDVVLTGQGPIWLYLCVAHTLHGKARRLLYRSPVTEQAGDIVVFDHSPF